MVVQPHSPRFNPELRLLPVQTFVYYPSIYSGFLWFPIKQSIGGLDTLGVVEHVSACVVPCD